MKAPFEAHESIIVLEGSVCSQRSESTFGGLSAVRQRPASEDKGLGVLSEAWVYPRQPECYRQMPESIVGGLSHATVRGLDHLWEA